MTEWEQAEEEYDRIRDQLRATREWQEQRTDRILNWFGAGITAALAVFLLWAGMNPL